ncbi:hypothetical protein T10_12992 [Trichinella papuae]|uniref:MARVEL domain-containing protein n=1 Tax=Trichinella papuae TaxID=268474 RepID=A0A0V1MWW1_9BILA|nr:hypothetical protein T10_12992 [Trichinella papuae]
MNNFEIELIFHGGEFLSYCLLVEILSRYDSQLHLDVNYYHLVCATSVEGEFTFGFKQVSGKEKQTKMPFKQTRLNTAALAGEHTWPPFSHCCCCCCRFSHLFATLLFTSRRFKTLQLAVLSWLFPTQQHVAGVLLANAIANSAAKQQQQQLSSSSGSVEIHLFIFLLLASAAHLFSLGFTKAMALTFDIGYLFSRPYGILRLSQVILCLLIVICISVADYSLAGTAFVWFTSVSSLISSAIILFLYVVHFNETEMFVRVPWFMAEFVVCCFWCLFHAISGIISAVNAANCVRCFANVSSCFGAAAFFCFAAAIAFGLCAYYLYGGWRLNVTSSNVQQQRTVTITTTTSRY